MSQEIDIAALRKAAQLEYPHEQMDAMALARYKVGPAGPGVWSSHAVRAGNGSLILWHGRKADCENVARRLTGAFLDGGTALFDLILPALLDRLEQAEKDAARYQFIRKNFWIEKDQAVARVTLALPDRYTDEDAEKALDAKLDAAMQGEGA